MTQPPADPSPPMSAAPAWLHAAGARPHALAAAAVPAALAALTRRIGAGLRCRWPGADAATLTLTLPPGAPAAVLPDEPPALALGGTFGTLLLQDGARVLRALTGIEAGPEQPAGPVRDWLHAALVGRLQGTPLAGVRTFGSQADRPAAGAVVLQLAVTHAGHAVVALASCGATGWLRLLADGPGAWRPLPCAGLDWTALAADVPVTLATHVLPAAALCALRPGDIVEPAQPRFDCGGAGVLRLGVAAWAVRWRSPGQLTIEGEDAMHDDEWDDAMHGAAAMADGAYERDAGEVDGEPDGRDGARDDAPEEELVDGGREAGPGDGAALPSRLPLSQLPVTLDFELGRLALTLGQLRHLAPGVVVEYVAPQGGGVAIRCGGQVVGSGEVVDVDGRLGVRILTWAEPA